MHFLRKFIGINFFFLLSIYLVCAVPEQLHASTNKIFDELRVKLIQLENRAEIYGSFEQTKHFQELDLTLKSNGTFKIQNTSKNQSQLEWSIVQPAKSKICMNQDKIVIIGEETQTLHLSEIDQKNYAQILLMMNLLGMNFDYLQKNLSISKDQKWYVFQPIEGHEFLFKKINLQVSSDGKVSEVQLFEKNNDTIHIQFKAVQLTKQSEPLSCLK